jgi:hypothetical protein
MLFPRFQKPYFLHALSMKCIRQIGSILRVVLEIELSNECLFQTILSMGKSENYNYLTFSVHSPLEGSLNRQLLELASQAGSV